MPRRKIIRRKEAQELGLPTFFTGKLCKRGRMSDRRTSNGNCIECHRHHNNLARLKPAYKKRAVEYARWRRRNPRYALWEGAKRRAKADGAEFTLTVSDIHKLWPIDDGCPVFGRPFYYGVRDGFAHPDAPSLDRFDNSIGYTRYNAAVISYRASTLKRDATSEELRLLTEWVAVAEEMQINRATRSLDTPDPSWVIRCVFSVCQRVSILLTTTTSGTRIG